MALFGSKKKTTPVAKVNKPVAQDKDVAKEKAVVADVKITHTPNASVIVRPLVSERSMLLSAQNQYVFIVDPSASKNEIKKQLEKMYGVSIIAVNSSIKRGTLAGFRGKRGGKDTQKKAIITLQKGQKIDIIGNR